ncbi:MAG: dicarboxylate/amino acid:cation symporter [Chlamydiales bacterium]|nr:dicarboxylate/amino acid:cation symporter [Chlamydiales bacterium]
MKLWMKILVAMALGVLTGLAMGESAAALKPIGEAFLRLIKMIVIPLVLSSMTVGITSIHDPQKLGRVGFVLMVLYFFTTVIAIAIGISLGFFFEPGSGLALVAPPLEMATAAPKAPSIAEMLLDVIPSNPFAALANENILQIIVFATFLGISINFAGERGRALLETLESLADVMYRMTSIVMEFTPVGVFAIMAAVTGTMGLGVLTTLLKFFLVYLLAVTIHAVFVHMGILYFLARLNPIPFLRGMSDALMLGFSTCSSSASLPVAMHCCQENLGVSKNIASFSLPLGTAFNMNGAAIFQGMAALFVAQAYGITLEWHQVIAIVVAAVMSAVGAAGIPGTGYLMLSVVLAAVPLPIEGLTILVGIDRLREMFSTSLNIMGDAVCCVYVAKREGELDERQYYHAESLELEGSDI